MIIRRHLIAARGQGHMWFRLFGAGLAWTDHRIHRPRFSERYAGRYGIHPRRFLHLGPYCLCTTTRRHP